MCKLQTCENQRNEEDELEMMVDIESDDDDDDDDDEDGELKILRLLSKPSTLPKDI